jgi:Flp pilus assembly protein TadB
MSNQRQLPGPTVTQLPSERVILAAPMSFHGSAARIWRLHERRNAWITALAVVLIAVAWIVVLSWYLFFGVWLVPYRLVRRGQRRRKREDLQHREILDAIERNQP